MDPTVPEPNSQTGWPPRDPDGERRLLAEYEGMNRRWQRLAEASGRPRPYAPQLQPLPDFPEVVAGNCPLCWPRVGQVRISLTNGKILGCGRGHGETDIAEALLAVSDAHREVLAEHLLREDLERLDQVIHAAAAAPRYRIRATDQGVRFFERIPAPRELTPDDPLHPPEAPAELEAHLAEARARKPRPAATPTEGN